MPAEPRHGRAEVLPAGVGGRRQPGLGAPDTDDRPQQSQVCSGSAGGHDQPGAVQGDLARRAQPGRALLLVRVGAEEVALSETIPAGEEVASGEPTARYPRLP
ncbi:hypothetical protein [Quadrisphaera granulorum]|uniref:hypothetical protein n=1 Tax=Quadrisphaera granulorum TaxID=317664 RepID=UPI0011B50A32|nr:hypothetical protein [Quadrisphaera granulorum]